MRESFVVCSLHSF